ncbi:hypothetical protein BDP27DRAFT_1371698 [Rhodocollybia butyracea]|uniref:Uncharacterized protein n=1 Tax=Rhodocollybia butyracea TaxID=206335 RepID=A0A9P5TX95_9AGAR|nr:hypothetical protein BDP27DRAFT_1371698 [Rhodocollybia butyracea]
MLPNREQCDLLPDSLVDMYLSITCEDDSSDILDDFKSVLPSFYELASHLVVRFDNAADATQANSFFFQQPEGLGFDKRDVPSAYSARMIWAYATAVQQRFNPQLFEPAKDPEWTPTLPKVKEHCTSFIALANQLNFLRTHVVGRKNVPLIIEGIFAAAQRLSAAVQSALQLNNTEPSWYLDGALIDRILASALHCGQTPNLPIPLPFDQGCRESAWLLTQGDLHFSWLDTGEPTDEEEEEEASDEDGPSEDRALPYEAISVNSEDSLESLKIPRHSTCSATVAKKTLSKPPLPSKAEVKVKTEPKAKPATVTPKLATSSATRPSMTLNALKAKGPARGSNASVSTKGKGLR